MPKSSCELLGIDVHEEADPAEQGLKPADTGFSRGQRWSKRLIQQNKD